MTAPVLMLGDCLERMTEIPTGSVDLILCDLPYGTTACKWDAVIPFDPLWAQYKRVIKSNGAIVLTASQPFTTALGASNLSQLRYAWVWEKTRPTGFLQAKIRPLKGFEDVLVFYANAPTYNPQGTTRVNRTVRNHGTKSPHRMNTRLDGDTSFHGNIANAKELYTQTTTGYPRGVVTFAQEASPVHPTQKPVALMEYLVKTYTNEGDAVLDNCMGSGTTGVACANTDRRFIGIERDPEYFRIASDRIADAFKRREEETEAFMAELLGEAIPNRSETV
jgi:site-specific DNA-methyltransferase (adenine-specific)